MNLQSLRGAFAPNRGYVCLHCRLRNAPIYFQQVLRNQHTSSDARNDSALIATSETLASVLGSDLNSQTKSPKKSKPPPTKLHKSAYTKLQNAKSQKNDQGMGQGDSQDIPPADLGRRDTALIHTNSPKKSRGIALSLNSEQKEEGQLQKNPSTSSPSCISDLVKKAVTNTSMKARQQLRKSKTERLKGFLRINGFNSPIIRRVQNGTNSIAFQKHDETDKRAPDEVSKKVTIPLTRRRVYGRRKLIRRLDVDDLREVRKVGDFIDLEIKSRKVFREVPNQQLQRGKLIRRLNVAPGPFIRRHKLSKDSRESVPKAGDFKDPESSLVKESKKVSSLQARWEKIDLALKKESDVESRVRKVRAKQLELNSIRVDQAPVPTLSYGLERVLFNPGVYQIQDLRTRVFNFDPYLQTIMPVAEFDFNSLKEYITSSGDKFLDQLAQKHGCRYVGSSSSMTGILSHFHYLLSQWRDVNVDMLSKGFPDRGLRNFTLMQRSPTAVFLRWKNGIYAIDADKEFASATVLSMLGKSMEKLLTLNTPDFERYRKSNPDQVSSEERNAPETYHYSTMGDFMMRAQLDAYDPRLPGSGTFDLKTRAVVSIRMDAANYSNGIGYEIKKTHGGLESYEREYFDMIRAAFLKYSLQVRMGKMDGIFVAFHNVERIFGFQYVSLSEMDLAVHSHSDTTFGDQEFKLSLDLLNKVLDRATKKYPNTSLRIHFETRETNTNYMYIFAEPVTEKQVKEIQTRKDAEIKEFERSILGLHEEKPRDEEIGWADIKASVQKAIEEDEMSVFDSENGESPSLSNGADFSLETKEIFPEDGDKMPLTNSEDNESSNSLNDTDFNLDTREILIRSSHEDDLADSAIYERTAAPTKSSDDRINSGEEVEVPRRGGEAVQDDIGEMHKTAEQENRKETEVLINENLDEQGHPQPDVALENPSPGVAMLDLQADSQPQNNPEPDELQISDVVAHEEEDIVEESNSKGDVPSLEQAERPPNESDVLAMTLTIRNKVQGRYVLRPENLRPDEEWEVEYSIAEVANPSRASLLYQACQQRRKANFEREASEKDGFLQMLKRMSRNGALWRKSIEMQDVGKPRVVLKETAVTTEESEMAETADRDSKA